MRPFKEQETLKSHKSFHRTGSRRAIALLMSFLLLLPLMIPAAAVEYTDNSEQLWETEDNNLLEEKAIPLPLGTVMNGSLFSGRDQDFFRFTVPEDGYAEIVLTYDAPDSSVLFVTLTCEMPYEMYGAVQSFFTDTEETVQTRKIGVFEGSYVVRLLNTDAASGEIPYKLSVNFAPEPNWKASGTGMEFEPNNNMDFSDDLPFDTPVSGVISSEQIGIYDTQDTDFYRIEVKERGFLEIRLNHEGTSDGIWDIMLYGPCSSALPPIASLCWFDVKAASESWKSGRVVVEPGEYWIRLTGEGTEGISYRIAASLTVAGREILDAYETENNDTMGKEADLLALDGTVRGNICRINSAGKSEQDCFRLDVKQSGYLRLKMRCADGTEVPSGEWGIKIFREGGSPSLVGQFTAAAQATYTTSPDILVNPGTYYAVVEGNEAVVGMDYELTAVFQASAYLEQEGDEYTNAKKIQFDTLYSGTIDRTSPWEEDRDYDFYSVEVPADGYLEVSLKHRDISDGEWVLSVYRLRGGELERVAHEKFLSSGTESRSHRIGVAPDTYYICLSSTTSILLDEAYQISVGFFRQASGEKSELENNDFFPDGAMQIPLNTRIHGTLSAITGYATTSDVDCFAFELPKSGRVEIELAHDAADGGSWKTELYSLDGEAEKLYTFKANGNDSAPAYLKFGADPGRYCIKLSSNDQPLEGVAYRLSVHFTETAFCEGLRDSSYKNAREMRLNTEYSGYYTLDTASSAGREVDYYKFSIQREGTVKLSLNHEALNISNWRLELLRYEKQLNPVYSYSGEKGDLNFHSVDIAVTPGTYYVRLTASVGKGSGDSYTLTVHGTGQEMRPSFTDVPSDAWYTPYVEFAVSHSLFKGTSETTFSPDMAMSRAMFVQLFANLDGVNLSGYTSTPFSDAPLSSWYGPAVAWAAQNGVVNGTSPTTFAPDDEITREQMCVLIINYAKYKGITLNETKTVTFSDASNISSWARDAVEVCANAGIINGAGDGTFNPSGTASRAEVATLMANFCRIVLDMA